MAVVVQESLGRRGARGGGRRPPMARAAKNSIHGLKPIYYVFVIPLSMIFLQKNLLQKKGRRIYYFLYLCVRSGRPSTSHHGAATTGHHLLHARKTTHRRKDVCISFINIH